MALVLDTFQVSYHSTPLFDPISLSVQPGETATIMGPSGCGKSTLLAAICGTLEPGFNHLGKVTLNGRSLADVSVEHRRVGILFQDDLLFPHLDVYGNMAFGLPPGLKGAERTERIRESLELGRPRDALREVPRPWLYARAGLVAPTSTTTPITPIMDEVIVTISPAMINNAAKPPNRVNAPFIIMTTH